MDCSPPGSSVHGMYQTRILEWVATSFSTGSSQPRDQTHICLASRFFNTEPPVKPVYSYSTLYVPYDSPYHRVYFPPFARNSTRVETIFSLLTSTSKHCEWAGNFAQKVLKICWINQLMSIKKLKGRALVAITSLSILTSLLSFCILCKYSRSQVWLHTRTTQWAF